MNWDAWLRRHYAKPKQPKRSYFSAAFSESYLSAVLANIYARPSPFAGLFAARLPEPKLTIRNGEVDWDFFLTRFYLKHPPRPQSDGPLKRNSRLMFDPGPEMVVGNTGAVG